MHVHVDCFRRPPGPLRCLRLGVQSTKVQFPSSSAIGILPSDLAMVTPLSLSLSSWSPSPPTSISTRSPRSCSWCSRPPSGGSCGGTSRDQLALEQGCSRSKPRWTRRPLARDRRGPGRGLLADGHDGNAERREIRRSRVPAARSPAALGHRGHVPPAPLIVAAVGDHVDVGAPGEVPGQVSVERAIGTRDDEEISGVSGIHRTSSTRCRNRFGMESGPPYFIREAIYVPAPSS